MHRVFLMFCAAVFAFRLANLPAIAAPPSYDIFCSSGSMTETAANIPGLRHFQFTTAASATQGPSVCGWFTRAWRAGEPTQLCISTAEMAQLSAAGITPRNGILSLGQVSSFAVYNDFAGCMVVTGFTAGESHAFAPSTLICKNAFNLNKLEWAGADEAFPFTAGTIRDFPSGSCYDSNGGALPPSGLLCRGKSLIPDLPSGVFAVSVKPWWPCGLAEIATGPIPGYTPPATPQPSPAATPSGPAAAPLSSYTFDVPVTIAVMTSMYAPPYSLGCSVFYAQQGNGFTYSFGEVVLPSAVPLGGGVSNFNGTVPIVLHGDMTRTYPAMPSMTYSCSILHGALPQKTTSITGANPGSILNVQASFPILSTSPIVTKPLVLAMP